MAEYRAFWLPRRGNTPEEYEDAFDADSAAGRFAVADGATESAFARPWALKLVEDFVRQTEAEPQSWAERLPMIQERWETAVGKEPLPWYVKEKYRRGAFATFLGLTVLETGDGAVAWRAVAIGDACLLHTRTKELLSAFPLARSDQFDNYPNLIGSRAAVEHVCQNLSVHACGDALPDDRLWLMTDALAQCCLARHETGDELWEVLESLRLSSDGDAEFGQWAETMRDDGGLRNDDVTLLAIVV